VSIQSGGERGVKQYGNDEKSGREEEVKRKWTEKETNNQNR
jgi:hypothetical protein